MRGKGVLVAALCAALVAGMATPGVAAPRGCDRLDPAHCLLPWPNDHFRKDGRLALRDSMMPRNAAGRPVRASGYNRRTASARARSSSLAFRGSISGAAAPCR